ncbi:MAG: S8 family serine peptidase [Cryomorphaceae bacterium]|nr:S8 family serine peptidase [Cryomorphaceae bacterium]
MRLILLVLCICCGSALKAQNAYWVFFTDKEGVEFCHETYFHPEALVRRDKHGIPRNHISDYPVKQHYIDEVCAVANYCGYASRWFNAVYVKADALQMAVIEQMPFVEKIEISASTLNLASISPQNNLPISKPADLAQISSMNGKFFKDNGFRGNGIRIAVFDAGFPEVPTHHTLSHLTKNNRVEATFHFAKENQNVFRSNAHGLMVLSNIAGKNESNQLLGLATGATFLLAITEIRREIFREEQWWLAAAEWADRNGAHIINSSLGYTKERYFPEDMDGETTLVTRAANMAAGKGILVVNAAGNEGNDNNWTYIGAPADADSVLAVGGISPLTGYKIGFSSIGPNFNGVLKPNVSAHGNTFVAQKGNATSTASGTSFAAPLVTGFAACLMQAMPELTNMEILKRIEQSGSLYPFFDYAHGYGIPQAHLALNDSFVHNIEPTFTVAESTDESITIRLNPEVYQHQRTLDELPPNHFYIGYLDKKGVLFDHYIVEPVETKFDITFLPKSAVKINLHFKGYTLQLSIGKGEGESKKIIKQLFQENQAPNAAPNQNE